MILFETNSGKLSRQYKQRAGRLNRGVKSGLRRIAALIDRKQVEKLRGGSGASAGAYPVPIRSADLFQGHFFAVKSERLAVVGNLSPHAILVHEGLGQNKKHGRRPFLEDAVNSVDAVDEFGNEVFNTVFAV